MSRLVVLYIVFYYVAASGRSCAGCLGSPLSLIKQSGISIDQSMWLSWRWVASNRTPPGREVDTCTSKQTTLCLIFYRSTTSYHCAYQIFQIFCRVSPLLADRSLARRGPLHVRIWSRNAWRNINISDRLQHRPWSRSRGVVHISPIDCVPYHGLNPNHDRVLYRDRHPICNLLPSCDHVLNRFLYHDRVPDYGSCITGFVIWSINPTDRDPSNIAMTSLIADSEEWHTIMRSIAMSSFIAILPLVAIA